MHNQIKFFFYYLNCFSYIISANLTASRNIAIIMDIRLFDCLKLIMIWITDQLGCSTQTSSQTRSGVFCSQKYDQLSVLELQVPRSQFCRFLSLSRAAICSYICHLIPLSARIPIWLLLCRICLGIYATFFVKVSTPGKWTRPCLKYRVCVMRLWLYKCRDISVDIATCQR